ncbi:MAG: HlyC/CorC family transporter [Flavobacteriaceae bacterium]|nr:HlyC/CorC family transporter [Flavobacteriaceae bacterium]
MEFEIIIIISSLILSAFFSGMEIAYVSSNKIHIALEKKQKNFISLILKRITRRPSKFIATMLVGNNIALVIYGFFMGELLMQYIDATGPFGFFLQTVISTLIILLTAEFLPKVFFQIYANTLIKVLALPAYLFYLLFSLISEFVIWISDFILKHVFKTKGDSVQLTFSKQELGNYISEQLEIVEENTEVDSEIHIFQNALAFSEVKSREVMLPRTEIRAVDIHTTPADLALIFAETGLSKLIVYKENIDHIIGYVHSFELFKQPKTIKSMMRAVVFVPETMLIADVLNSLTKTRKSIAIVLDEYGGTSGLITVEDIVEELFGEIEDEHDTTVLIENQLDDTHFLFSARIEVDYLNEKYKLNLPENENYETLGGLIVNYTETIPKQGETIYIEHFNMTIKAVSNIKIELVELKLIPQE